MSKLADELERIATKAEKSRYLPPEEHLLLIQTTKAGAERIRRQEEVLREIVLQWDAYRATLEMSAATRLSDTDLGKSIKRAKAIEGVMP